jgi:ferric-dicitrate binding protein FerR (iron transport regulator)
MSRARQAAVAVAVLRMAYGAALALAPARTARNWIGADGTRPAAGVALRALGAREIVLHAGAAAAAVSGAPVRPWLVASIGGDCSDILATYGARANVPDDAPGKTLAVAGGSAALSAAVVAVLDR